MTRRCVAAYQAADLRLQRCVQRAPGAQDNEEHHTHIALPLLADHHTFQHGTALLNLAIDLRGANAHTTRVQHRIGSPMDDEAAVGGLLAIITLRPDPVEPREVGRVEAAAIGVIPETQGTRREGRSAHQLALLFLHWAPLVIPYRDRHSQPGRLDFTRVYRQSRRAPHETGENICATGDAGQADVPFEVAIHILVVFMQQGRPGGQYRFQAAQIVTVCGTLAGLLQRRNVLGTGTEYRDAFRVDGIQ